MVQETPDWFTMVKPSRTILAEGQARYAYLTSVEVAADGGYLEVGISPAENYDLTPSSIEVSCEASCIQTVEFYKDDGILHRGYFDISRLYMYPDLSSYLIHDTEYFKVIIVNNDSVARRMNITIFGTLEKVS